jgi:molecular chaperone HtpG
MTDFADEWVVQSLPEYKEKKLRSAEKGDLDFQKVDEDKKESLAGLFEHIKKLLEEKIRDVKPSTRLKDSVACLAGDTYDMGSYMEKILKATGQDSGASKRILEINMGHPVVEKLNVMFGENQEDPRVDDYIRLIYDMAVISEGGKIDDPGNFSKMVGHMMADSLGE